MGERGKPLHTDHIKGTVWINDGETQKRVNPDELDLYLDNGWVLGYTKKAKDNLSRSHLGQIPVNKGVPLEENKKEHLSKMWLGSRKMTNGEKVIQAKKEEIDYYLSIGYNFYSKKGGDNNEKS